MNKLREKFETENLYTRHIDTFDTLKPTMKIEAEQGKSVGWEGFGERFEYNLTLTVGAKFRANSVELEQAQKQCETLVLRTLYADLLRKTAEIRNAINSGKKEDAYMALMELEKLYI